MTQNLIGKRFGKLLVLERAENNKYNSAQWLCKCDCGKITKTTTCQLTSGKTKSCGCLKYESRNYTHRMTHTRLHNIWAKMRQRCNSPKDNCYYRYGAKGITVCDEWNHSFESFYEWSMKNGYSDSLTIDRIDNSKGYYPENCRWVTFADQQRNKSSNIVITYNGETKILAEWCRYFNVNYSMVRERLKRNWTFEKAIFTPSKKVILAVTG